MVFLEITEINDVKAGVQSIQTRLYRISMNGVPKKKKAAAVPKTDPQWISLWDSCGGIVCILCGVLYPYVVHQIHDSRVFFSGISEVEREISFRTENGLYYSYYKHLVHSPSFIQGLQELISDPLTEHPSHINVLSRMNVYQEVLLAVIYRTTPYLSSFLQPIIFYVYSIFFLHSILTSSLFMLSWFISGSWLGGLYTFLLYMHHWGEVTRVETYMPLRECFSLPFLWLQLLLIHVYFKDSFQNKYKTPIKTGIFLSTFLFALCWQFNQFALLLQASSLLACQLFNLVPLDKLKHIYICHLASMLLVCVLQFINTMLLSGFLVSLALAALCLMYLQKKHPYSNTSTTTQRLLHVTFNTVFVVLVAVLLNVAFKKLLQHQADEHINRFLLSKFGFKSSIDFDVKLYLCNGGFGFLDVGFIGRLGVTIFLYFLSHVSLLVLLCGCVLLFVLNMKKDSDSVFNIPPQMCYHAVQIVSFGGVGIIALRMKYFWTPYICIYAALCVFKWEAWQWIFEKVSTRLTIFKTFSINAKHISMAIGVVFIAYYAQAVYGVVNKEMTDLREFYDPDTVELMEWISNSTAPDAAFSGSMQLMAAVKLSTLRPITNHPHYEDKGLRIKTKDLSKYYGRYSAQEVHTMLKNYKSSYIIMEDSICKVPHRDGCGMPYIMDAELGVEYDKDGQPIGDGVNELPDRFCDEVRYGNDPYNKYFKEVMKNKTFRVYKVL